MIIVNVLGVVPYMGWVLGSSEAVGLVICVGFAVDYVVHLAAHYVHSRYVNREDRIKESLREIGISILSGGMTTMLACLPLFICVIELFEKFAILVISTVIFSVIFSLGFFSATCYLIGPTGELGNYSYHYNSFIEWLTFHYKFYKMREAEGEEGMTQYVKDGKNPQQSVL